MENDIPLRDFRFEIIAENALKTRIPTIFEF